MKLHFWFQVSDVLRDAFETFAADLKARLPGMTVASSGADIPVMLIQMTVQVPTYQYCDVVKAEFVDAVRAAKDATKLPAFLSIQIITNDFEGV